MVQEGAPTRRRSNTKDRNPSGLLHHDQKKHLKLPVVTSERVSAVVTFGVSPASCFRCWLILAVFLAMLWVLIRLILSLMLSCSVFLYLSAETKAGSCLNAGAAGRKMPPDPDPDPNP